MAAYSGMPFLSAYSASKGALTIMIKNIANNNEQNETTNVCTNPIKTGASNSSIIFPINIMCKLQNIAPINTKVSPSLTVAS